MNNTNVRLKNEKRDLRIDYLKGLAMIMVVLLHSIQMIDRLSEIIRKPILLGQIGVQLFFLCSGFLAMKPHVENGKTLDNGFVFLKKKYVGLLVPFVIFMAIYLMMNYVYVSLQIKLPYRNNTDMLSIALNALLLHGFFPQCLNNVVPGGWYVGTLLILFALTPLIIKFIKSRKTILIAAFATALISVTLSVVLHHLFDVDTSNGSYFYFSFFNQAPAYLVGMSLAFENDKMNGSITLHIICDAIAALSILILFYFEFSFSYAVIPFLAALLFADVYKMLSAVPALIEKTKWICRIGQNTFVIYLSHFLVVWYIPLLIEMYFHVTGIFMFMIVVFLSAVLCMVSPYISSPLNKLTKWILKHIN